MRRHYESVNSLPSLSLPPQVLPLVFSATDSLGATGTFTLRLEVCACRNGGNCTLEGVVNPSADVVIMNCICPPGNPESYEWHVIIM